jgi:hypothetical protein
MVILSLGSGLETQMHLEPQVFPFFSLFFTNIDLQIVYVYGYHHDAHPSIGGFFSIY